MTGAHFANILIVPKDLRVINQERNQIWFFSFLEIWACGSLRAIPFLCRNEYIFHSTLTILQISWMWWQVLVKTQIAKFTGPTWFQPGFCRPQIGPMLAPWTLLPDDLSTITSWEGRSFNDQRSIRCKLLQQMWKRIMLRCIFCTNNWKIFHYLCWKETSAVTLWLTCHENDSNLQGIHLNTT